MGPVVFDPMTPSQSWELSFQILKRALHVRTHASTLSTRTTKLEQKKKIPRFLKKKKKRVKLSYLSTSASGLMPSMQPVKHPSPSSLKISQPSMFWLGFHTCLLFIHSQFEVLMKTKGSPKSMKATAGGKLTALHCTFCRIDLILKSSWVIFFCFPTGTVARKSASSHAVPSKVQI